MAFALHHQVLAAPGTTPRGYAAFLHGILGQGSNWRTPAQQLIRRDPGWGAVLIDLRLHGRSRGAPPPHTLAAAADDVEALAATLAGQGVAVRAYVGHSFGGKVALALHGRAPAGLVATAVFDASPSARDGGLDAETARRGSAAWIVELLGTLPTRYARRDELVAELGARGLSAGLGQWLAMSLTPADGGFVLDLDLPGIRALLADYFGTDLWPAVEDAALPGALSFYVAGRSSTLSGEDRARLEALAPRVTTRVFPDADHWMMGERDELELPTI